MRDKKFEGNWVDADEICPPYYQPVIAKFENGFIGSCWRASDGEKEFFTIYKTDRIIDSRIISWKEYDISSDSCI